MTFISRYGKLLSGWYFMKSRSELREIVMKILYQVFILKEASVEFDVEKLKKEQLEIENDFVRHHRLRKKTRQAGWQSWKTRQIAGEGQHNIFHISFSIQQTAAIQIPKRYKKDS